MKKLGFYVKLAFYYVTIKIIRKKTDLWAFFYKSFSRHRPVQVKKETL
jgi:hypothetical protein